MKKASTQIFTPQRFSLLQIIPLLACLFAIGTGCQPDRVSPGPEALALRDRIQSNLDPILPELSANFQQKKRKQVKAILDTLYASLNQSDEKSPFFLALLDSHGVTITSRTKTLLSGSQNYGNYHVIAKVIQKRKTITSSLYLQGGAKVYIICVPLMNKTKLAGVIILGIDSEYLRKSGISEQQFMTLDFNSPSDGTP
ncbi:MAG: hypothetical protein EG822_01630 [Deltaproteobacteria bacterium]|nr:hypothetical protein [Deltaproteobacteria bacterium]